MFLSAIRPQQTRPTAPAVIAMTKLLIPTVVDPQVRYKNGIANYFEVLDAERELFAAEQQLLQTRLLRLTNAVDLYRSLGGGLNEVSK